MLVIFRIEITGRIGRMNFINQIDLFTQFSEFVFGIDKYESFSGSDLLSAGEQSQCVFLELLVILSAY